MNPLASRPLNSTGHEESGPKKTAPFKTGVRVRPYQNGSVRTGGHRGVVVDPDDGLQSLRGAEFLRSHNFSTLPDGVFDTVLEYAGRLPSPHCEIFIGRLGGAAGRVAPDAMAYGNRDANFVMNVHGRWETPQEDAACIGWARDFFRAAARYATGGVYVNFMKDDGTDRIASAYGANYARLTQIKAKYDPKNLFRVNQNITPAR
jgi:hypothetical protein